MLVILWQYEIKPDRAHDFEAFYGPDGPWDEFFHEAPGFVSVTLMKDLRQPGRYLVSDRWTSEAAYDGFVTRERARYEAISARGARLIDREVEIGRFGFLE